VSFVIFSITMVSMKSGLSSYVLLTYVKNISATATIESQRGAACWTVLGLEFPEIFIEARFVCNVTAGQLQYSLAFQGVLQMFFAYCALTANKGSILSGPGAVQHTRHTTSRAGSLLPRVAPFAVLRTSNAARCLG
jgi:hypothetical protein